MNKIKRILALMGAILLACLYVSTLVFALIGSELSLQLLKASVAATILIPVLLYGIILISRLTGNKDDSSDVK